MQKVLLSINQYEIVYNELRQFFSNYQGHLFGIVCFLANVVYINSSAAGSSQFTPSHVSTILSTSDLTKLQREFV